MDSGRRAACAEPPVASTVAQFDGEHSCFTWDARQAKPDPPRGPSPPRCLLFVLCCRRLCVVPPAAEATQPSTGQPVSLRKQVSKQRRQRPRLLRPT